ncbi:hypothetical protein ACNAW0_11940 [Micromonospora sp. SL1-18]|uniref:hypothetical protein n=1 Tax=Micromonospora sp. SL1-18 TaxID=3399128 RepID=UPI003A4E6516
MQRVVTLYGKRCLIAYQLVRQPPVATILATGAVSVGSYLIIISGILAGLVPVS